MPCVIGAIVPGGTRVATTKAGTAAAVAIMAMVSGSPVAALSRAAAPRIVRRQPRANLSTCAVSVGSVSHREEESIVQHEGEGSDNFFERIGKPRFIAAPMVEHSEAAFRYLVRRHGCDLTFTQMLHSGRFAPQNARRFREQRFDGVDDAEDRPLIAQFCGNDPSVVVQAARHIEGAVDAVDLNLGCPQRIARKGNYGAFLLSKPDLCEQIVARMSRDLTVPVTVKIRVLEKDSDTLDLARRLEGAGAQMITVHGRTLQSAKTTQGVANWAVIAKVKRAVSVPVVANGGVETRADAVRLLEATGVDAVMSSEGLLEDPSLFDRKLTPMDQLQGAELAHRILSLASEYMELVQRFPTPAVSVKGHLFKMLYRLLEYNHDLRDRLGKNTSGAVEADAILRELCSRYSFDPDSRTPRPHTTSDLRVSPKRWYRRHWPDSGEICDTRAS